MNEVKEVVEAVTDIDHNLDDQWTAQDKAFRSVMKELGEIKAMNQQILDHLPTVKRELKNCVGDLKVAKNNKRILKVIGRWFRKGGDKK